VLKVFFFSVG